MDFELIFAFLFIIFLTLFLYIKRKKLFEQKVIPNVLHIMMYRTKLGLQFMDKTAKKFPKTLNFLSYISIATGFFFMAVISGSLFYSLFILFKTPEAVAGVGLVLPVPIKGAFYVPFFYWIISIFILAIVHEASHGIFARLNGMKIKSSGFAFMNLGIGALGLAMVIFTIQKTVSSGFALTTSTIVSLVGIIFIIIYFFKKSFTFPVVPAAFVEPDEVQLKKASVHKQLSVYAAGPFSNIVLGFLILALFIFAIVPFASNIYMEDGINIESVVQDYPADLAGLQPGDKIIAIDSISTLTSQNLSDALNDKNPGETILIETESGKHNLTLTENPTNISKSYMGITLTQSTKINPDVEHKYGKVTISVFLWIIGLLYWLYILNIGIGLFNLLPLGPIDGGRMINAVLQKYYPKKAEKYFRSISLFFLLLLLANLILPYFI